MTERLNDTAMTAFWNYWYNTARSNTRVRPPSSLFPFIHVQFAKLLQDWYLIVDLHGGPSSAITKLGPEYSSYAHRNALLKYEFYDRVNSGSYPSNGFSFLNGWVDTVVQASKYLLSPLLRAHIYGPSYKRMGIAS
jgi:hypothetical protein